MRKDTGSQASQDVVFDKYTISTPLFPIFIKPTSLYPLIIPTYLHNSGPGCPTTAADRLWDGQGWVGTIYPHTHTCYCFDHHHVFCFCLRGIRSHGLGRQYGDDRIRHRIPNNRPVREFCVYSTGDTIRSIPSKSSDPCLRLSSASACECSSYILRWSGVWSGCNPIWPVIWGGR